MYPASVSVNSLSVVFILSLPCKLENPDINRLREHCSPCFSPAVVWHFMTPRLKRLLGHSDIQRIHMESLQPEESFSLTESGSQVQHCVLSEPQKTEHIPPPHGPEILVGGDESSQNHLPQLPGLGEMTSDADASLSRILVR